DPTSWTLLFRHGRTTILLFASPLTPFTTLKSELLSTLRERYPSGLPNPSPAPSSRATIALPPSPDDIVLGALHDEHDREKGWRELDTSEGESPQSLGLKDRAHIAFAFDEEGFVVEYPGYEEYDQAEPGAGGKEESGDDSEEGMDI
ncbi:hypothetical protein B0O99DRAFT_518276, partial [Bisporella sp. PMI_857]